jgi:hypothetical protein
LLNNAVANFPSALPCVAFMTAPTSAPMALPSPAQNFAQLSPLSAITRSTPGLADDIEQFLRDQHDDG